MDKLLKRCCMCKKVFLVDEELPFYTINNEYLCSDCCQEAAIKFDEFLNDDPKSKLIPISNSAENLIISMLQKQFETKSIENSYTTPNKNIFNKREIFIEVTKHVKGQDKQIKKLISAITENQLITDSVYKNNIIIVGNTGCGKTFSLTKILSNMNICYTFVDANNYSEVGYIGNDIEDCIQSLANTSKDDLSKAERGVVIIDEFDKLRSQGGIGRDVSGTSVQEELLTLMSGTKVRVTINGKRGIEFDTSFVTFILMGAFDDTNQDGKLTEIRKKRLNEKKELIGFKVSSANEDVENSLFNEKLYLSEDFSKYGIIPQVTGRCPVILEFNELTKEMAMDILLNSESSKYSYFIERFKRYGIDIILDDSLLDTICEYAIKDKTGARGLNRFLEILFSEALEQIEYDYDDNIYYNKCVFYADSVINNTHYTLTESTPRRITMKN